MCAMPGSSCWPVRVAAKTRFVHAQRTAQRVVTHVAGPRVGVGGIDGAPVDVELDRRRLGEHVGGRDLRRRRQGRPRAAAVGQVPERGHVPRRIGPRTLGGPTTAFDHRRSLDRALAGLAAAPGRSLDRLAVKRLIWRGVEHVMSDVRHAAVLVDAEAGPGLDAARRAGVTTAMALERSGQRWLEPEHPVAVTQGMLAKHRPDYAKLLVRWHPADPAESRTAQIEVIRRLADLAEHAGAALMIELLVPPNGPDALLGSARPEVYRDEVLPGRTADAIGQLYEAGVAPLLWKLDGFARPSASALVDAAVDDGSGGAAGIVVLGAGRDIDTLSEWFRTTAGLASYRGFAVGRTIWWDAVRRYVIGELDEADAVTEISHHFAAVVAAYRVATTTTTAAQISARGPGAERVTPRPS